MPAAHSKKAHLVNAALAIASCVVVLVCTELMLRLRYAEAGRKPTPEILAIQPHLRLHDTLGFTWNPDISPEENIVFEVADVRFEPLSTDDQGFQNLPEAIAERRAGLSINVVGLGDSFVEHANRTFYETFKDAGFRYYSMAVHRQAPPQYNTILEDYAIPLQPQWIVYGLFENDFLETEDFDHWRNSGLDWFEYHSGTWCGPAVPRTPLMRFKNGHLRGYGGLFNVVRARIRGDNVSLTGPSTHQIDRVREEIRRAGRLASNAGAKLLLVLIPSRATTLDGASPESAAYDILIDGLAAEPINVLDLRGLFQNHPDPASLYYRIDGHWKKTGIVVAAEAILERVHDETPRDAGQPSATKRQADES